jgi:hypothetical protein
MKDSKYFWNYNQQGAKSVKTANHGTLLTLASGDCVALVQCRKLCTRITLQNCLHASSAIINLLSVGQMVSAGFGCNFEDNRVIILAPHPNQQIFWEGPMLNNLFFLDIGFVPALLKAAVKIPRSLHKVATSSLPISPSLPCKVPLWMMKSHALQKCLLTLIFGMLVWDMWGKRLLFKSSPAQLEHPSPTAERLTNATCASLESIMMFPTPATNSSSHAELLELIFCDICGPFPIHTLHGKL